ncbi:MAG TPA: reverse transcriptase/maturase family protein [Candidatus Nanoarchaeia archaeon]|nr:reverse transcriptase/maturase family protein [Candidatus Nanoarchaeia archaeon]
MKTYRSLKLISIANLKEAYEKARKRKSRNQAVQEFDKHWQLHLVQLYKELKTGTYSPKPLKTFILRDPKTRTISVSDFRDRVVHHALVNVLQPIFEPRFIVDSYASRKGKGTTAALDRFYLFLRQVTRNGRVLRGAENKNTVVGFAFKADIKSYFDSVDHDVLFGILSKRVKDESVLWLIQKILDNYTSGTSGKGMPLGNWTSQFFANVYLNELDQFVKHQLKAKYYLRYVDDFIIVHSSKITLQEYEHRVRDFLRTLKLELHPTKCKIFPLGGGRACLDSAHFTTI